jgi:hypothetical protein
MRDKIISEAQSLAFNKGRARGGMRRGYNRERRNRRLRVPLLHQSAMN